MRCLISEKNGLKVVNLNRKKAVRKKCLNCAGYSCKEVAECSFRDCPLYPFRNPVEKQDAKKRAYAIRRYCLWCCNGERSEVSRCPAYDCPLFPYRLSKVDRSTEIVGDEKKRHMEAVLEA